MFGLLTTFAALLFAAAPATASSSQWQENEGASMRLVTAGAPDDEGRVSGALEIRLKPGWKTYWRDPGEAGIPPQIDISRSINVVSAEIAFPAPVRVKDDYSEWAGYTAPVSLPVTFMLSRPDAVALIDADVFLGVCETICIPVQATFTLDPGAGRDDPRDVATVKAAYAALPDTAGPGFRVNGIERSGETLLVGVEVPEDADQPALFVAPPEGFVLGTPKPSVHDDGALVFSIKQFEAPGDGGPRARPFRYTLVAGGRAVEGEFTIP